MATVGNSLYHNNWFYEKDGTGPYWFDEGGSLVLVPPEDSGIQDPIRGHQKWRLPTFGAATPGGDPTPPTLASFSSYQTDTNEWRNIPWSTAGYPTSWIEPAHGGDTFQPIFHLWTPTVVHSGRWHLRLHFAGAGAGGTPDIPDGGQIDTQWKQPLLAQGDVVMSGTFPHSGIFVNSTGLYQTNDIDIVGKLIQYVRSLHDAFDFDVDKLTVTPQSRGNHVLITAFRPDLANPVGSTYQSRMSSLPNLIAAANSQFAYNTRRAGEEACSDWATEQAAFYAHFGNADETRTCAGDLIAGAPQLPLFVTSYDLEWPSVQYASADGKVPVATVIAANSSHWPQSGNVFAREYALRGESDRFLAWANSEGGGDAEQLGYFPVLAREVFAGASLQEAMATAVAKKSNHSAIGIRTNLVGIWQDSAATVPVTTAGNPIGAVADMRTGIADAATSPPGSTVGNTGVPGGQATAAQRTTLVAVGNGWGFGVVPTQRVLVAHTGTSNDGREGRSWTAAGVKYTVPSLLPGAAIGFGTAQLNAQIMVFAAAAPLGTPITAQQARIYDHMMYLRRNTWTAFLTELGVV